MKYARLELERRFLLAARPDRLTSPRTITDHYLEGLRLRLRRIDHVDGRTQFKLGQKFTLDEPWCRQMTTLYVSEAEYETLRARLAAGVRPFQKRRFDWGVDDLRWVVDEITTPSGVAWIAEIEEQTPERLLAVTAPVGALREVTNLMEWDCSVLARDYGAQTP